MSIVVYVTDMLINVNVIPPRFEISGWLQLACKLFCIVIAND